MGGRGPLPVVMHWKSPGAKSRIRWPSNCPGLLQKTAGTVVLVFSSHSTNHLILQSQASVLPRRSLPRTAPSHPQHPVTPGTQSSPAPSALPQPRAAGCHPLPSPVSPVPHGAASQVTQDVQRLEEVPGQRLQVVVGQGPGGGGKRSPGHNEGARATPGVPGEHRTPRYSQVGQGLEPAESGLGERLDVVVLDEPGAGGDGGVTPPWSLWIPLTLPTPSPSPRPHPHPTHRYWRCERPAKALSPISVNLLELSRLPKEGRGRHQHRDGARRAQGGTGIPGGGRRRPTGTAARGCGRRLPRGSP